MDNLEQKYYIGLDIGGTKCAATLGTLDGVPCIIKKEQFATAGLKPFEVLDRFSLFIEKQLTNHRIAGIGISCGGPLDSKLGIVMSPPSLPDWDNVKVVDYFQDRYSVPTYLQNDANACAVAEWKYGAGRGSDNMVFLTFGTGFGGGLIMGGKLYPGANDNAGEIGHVRLTASGPEGYHKNGSCEGYCSGGGITRMARLMLRQKRYAQSAQVLLDTVGSEENITTKAIAELAKNGDPFCRAVFDRSGRMLGKTLSILVDLLNPERIIIGGVFMRSSDLLLKETYRVMKKECLAQSLDAVSVLPAGLGEKIGDYAALAVAKGDFLQ